MSGLETIFIIISNFVILSAFFSAGAYHLPQEYTFGFYKFFSICLIVYFCFEFIKLRLYSRFKTDLLNYMQRNIQNPNSEIQEVHFSHRLFPFYQALLVLLNKLVPDTDSHDQIEFSLKPYLALSKDEKLSKTVYMEKFLSQLQSDIPDSQYFIFGVSNNQIQLLQSLCLDPEIKSFIKQSSKDAKPFVHENSFSFKAFNEKKPIVSNELVNDENFAQFLSRTDLNTPIFGGVFPIVVHNKCIGFLWIKCVNPHLEVLKKHQDSFDLLPLLLANKIYHLEFDPSFTNPQYYDSSFFFHQKANQLTGIALNVSNPSTVLLMKVNVFRNEQNKEALQNIFSILKSLLPKHAIFMEEANLITITFSGGNQKKTLLIAAKILDKTIKYLQIESGPPSSGELNIGISFLEDAPDLSTEEFYNHNINQAKLALKESILAGPDQLRIFEEEETNEQ
ncbi:MAG: hypothetical protein KC646_12135 [Candidatus Cloacimonetes bacterium]|nr:hypothetical protein [Candidatus Cloacimonadota bacterium]